MTQNEIKYASYRQLRGGSNINYEIVFPNNLKLFLKHNPKDANATIYGDTLEREYKICSYLYSKSKLAPEPLIHDPKENILISEFVNGRAPNIHDRDFSRTLTLMGYAINDFRHTPISLLQEFNTQTRACPRNFFDKVLKPAVSTYSKKLLKEGSTNLFQFLEDITAILTDKLRYEPKKDCFVDWISYENDPRTVPHGLLHNDMALRNVIITNDPSRPICFIDWEYVDFGDVAYDMAYLQSENQLLTQQINVLASIGHLSKYIHERTIRYIRIFLPMLELINCYWTIDHITSMISSEETQKGKKLKLRSPYSLTENLNFINNKIKRLVRLSNLNNGNKHTELELLNEIQLALKIFERQLTIV